MRMKEGEKEGRKEGIREDSVYISIICWQLHNICVFNLSQILCVYYFAYISKIYSCNIKIG